ncbi:MAG: asparagine synthase-related protein, partial [candidate division WOR-3 bacterium]
IYLIRDKSGIKPLYYSFYKNGIVFSSEIKPILQIIDNKDINEKAILNHITFLFNFNDETAFKNVYKLKPAHILEFSERGYNIYQYWDYKFSNNIESLILAKKEFIETFDKVIKSQLISDTEVSVFLSGGIDSSLISLFASKYKNLKAFSLIYPQKYQKNEIIKDEFYYALEIAKKLNFEIEAIEFDLNEDLLDKFVYYIEEPVGDVAGISTYLMCDYNKSRVVLSGMGGDELFGGYPRYKAYSIYKKFHFLQINKIPFPNYFKKLSRDIEKFKRVWGKPYYYYLSYFNDIELKRLAKTDYNPFHKAQEIYEKIEGNYYEKMLIFDFKTFLPHHNLLYSDKLSMAKSVELRVPFLDDRILELSRKLNYKLKVDKLLIKSVLNEYFPKITKRKKMGFGGPIRSWIFKNEKFISNEIKYLKRLDFLNFKEIENILNFQFKGKRFLDLNVFELLVISRWLKIFRI